MKVALDLISLNNAAKQIGCHKTLLYYYIRKNLIPFYEIDGHYFLDFETIGSIREGKLNEFNEGNN